jgi:hypothetical protein
MIDAADLIEACRAMFIRHRVEGFGGLFHVPATHEYRWLFAWDSGYHALALQHLDRGVALSELRTLYAANTTDDGLLAHEQPLPGLAARVAWIVDWLGPIYRPDGRSWLIDPPVAAYAAATLFRPELGDGTELLEAASGHLRAMEAVRRLPDGGGPVILHPLESGADASPLFDGLIDVSSRAAFLAGHRKVSEVNRGAGWSVERLLATADAFIVSDPILCGWRLVALEAVADAWRRAGDLARAAAFDASADEAAETLIRELWHDGLELFVGFDHVRQRQLPVPTLGGVIAAASQRIIDVGLGARIVAAHLTPPDSRFWGPAGLAFNPLDGRAIGKGALLWRGDVVWGATVYWAHMALLRNQRPDLAARARGQLEELIRRSGFREYYSAETGEGFGAGKEDGFTWPALVLEMRAECPP